MNPDMDVLATRIEKIIDLKLKALPCEIIKEMVKANLCMLSDRIDRVDNRVNKLMFVIMGNLGAFVIGVIVFLLKAQG